MFLMSTDRCAGECEIDATLPPVMSRLLEGIAEKFAPNQKEWNSDNRGAVAVQ